MLTKSIYGVFVALILFCNTPSAKASTLSYVQSKGPAIERMFLYGWLNNLASLYESSNYYSHYGVEKATNQVSFMGNAYRDNLGPYLSIEDCKKIMTKEYRLYHEQLAASGKTVQQRLDEISSKPQKSSNSRRGCCCTVQ